MEHHEHVNLLRDGVPDAGGVWADLGSGGGAFTLALAELLGPGAVIHSVDRNGRALREQAGLMQLNFPDTVAQYHEADFTRPLDLPPLDGVVMANALHFVRDKRKDGVLRHIYGWLKPGGRVIVVEYNVDRGNIWVPHPFSYDTWAVMAERSGFTQTRLIATRPSRHLREIYAAVSVKP